MLLRLHVVLRGNEAARARNCGFRHTGFPEIVAYRGPAALAGLPDAGDYDWAVALGKQALGSAVYWIGIDCINSHEPAQVRQHMTDAFADRRTPSIAWQYLPISQLVPDRDEAARGTPIEIQKLADGLVAFYRDRSVFFDDAAFARDLELRFAIERGEAE